MKDMDGKDLIAIVATILLPPLGVAIKVGFGTHFWVNLALTIFGFYLPGLVHGMYVVLSSDS
jgi:uncharacterized membrane protein YqaE (UPF0057 family)